MPEIHPSDIADLTEEIFKKLTSKIRDAFGPTIVIPPYFDDLKATNGNPLSELIKSRIEEDVAPEFWNDLAFDILVDRHIQIPEVVERGIWGYLVRVEYDSGDVLTSRISGKPLTWDTWGTYFKTVKNPQKVIDYLLNIVLSENENLTPDGINSIEVLPGIPYDIMVDYLNEKITIDDIKDAIDDLPAL